MQWALIVQILLILGTKLIFISACNCFISHEDYKCRLGMKTPYRFIANTNDSPFEYPGCTPKKIWLLVRHGTRYPSKKHMSHVIEDLPHLQQVILQNYERNKTHLKSEDLNLLADWKLAFANEDSMKLALEGENELIDLAERYQSRFSSIMPDIYDNGTYKFKYTATQRTEESAKHFAAGLFGWSSALKVRYPKPEYQDPILRFYKRCRRWRNEIKKNPSAQAETEMFLKGEIYTKMLNDISNRIGHRVDNETAHLMYLTCGFETALNRGTESPWCKMLSSNDFKVLEFAEDLHYYWIDGYGHSLTYEQACPALKDVFDFFLSTEGPSVSAYFTHSGTVLKLLALLGVAKDDRPLTHNLFPLYADDRAWRTSIIDTFASNIAFVLYECSTGGPSVLFIHQERPVYLSGCPLDVPCPLSIMKALYPNREEECEFDAMCGTLETGTES